jgi:DNA-binding transcriptional ArsR family regulator
MAPLVTADTDELRSMIAFRTSTLYEMWLSLTALQNPGHRHQEWADEVRARLPHDLLQDLQFLYGRFEKGILLMELAIAYPDHHDVDGFFQYVEQMSTPQFLFYVLGRLTPAEEMAKLEPTLDSLLSLVAHAFPEGSKKYEERFRTAGYLELLADPEGHRARMLRLWRGYWEHCFKEESEEYQQIWRESTREKSMALSRQDALEFIQRLTEKHDLPDQIPPEYTTEEILLVPSYFAPHQLVFYGYGSITLIYDCQMTEERREQLERLQEEIIATAKALDDKTRLELLKWIVRDPQVYGRKLAEACHISQPSVSRHLRILKQAGIIEERPIDNRIAYEVHRQKIESLSDQLIAYLYQEE